MSYKLLESLSSEGNDVSQQIDDGATINFLAAHSKNGAVYGCTLKNTINEITISPGILMVRGFRLKIESDTVIFSTVTAGLPSIPSIHHLFLRIVRTGNNATASFRHSIMAKASTDEIDKSDGVYDFKIATFNLTPRGISSKVASLIPTINPSDGGSSSAVSIVLPTPRLELVSTDRAPEGLIRGMLNSYLCLANKYDYKDFVTNYTIKFVMYRHIQRGRYREYNNSNKLHINKTGYVKCNGDLGWRYHLKEDDNCYDPSYKPFAIAFNYTDLQQIIISKSGNYEYKRSDMIEAMYKYVDTIFYKYDPISRTKAVIDENTTAMTIRAARSKRNGKKAGNYRHNYFKFAFKAVLYDSTGKRITESGLSNAITIRPNYRLDTTQPPENNLSELFILTAI